MMDCGPLLGGGYVLAMECVYGDLTSLMVRIPHSAYMHTCAHICMYARIYAYMTAYLHTGAHISGWPQTEPETGFKTGLLF